jgi:amino acid adenylation domain-containing protein
MSDVTPYSIGLPPEQEAIRAKCFHPSGTFVEFSKEEIEQSIPDRFEKIVAQHPDRIAVKTEEHVFTYDALNRAANSVAWAVLSEPGECNEPVAILLEHGAPGVVAILGVLKAGGSYVPLDPTCPQERIANILRNSQARVVLTNNKNLFLARTLSKNAVRLINIDELDPGFAPENLRSTRSAGAIAFILYTSGTTGEPKGVVQNHRNVLYNIMTYTNDIHVGLEDRLTLLYPSSSHGSVRNLFGALLNGAGLYPFDVKQKNPAELVAWLLDKEITIYHSVSTLFRSLTNVLTGEERFTNLRLIQLASESVTSREIELYRTYFSPNCILVNRLGTTETGTFQRYFIDKKTILAAHEVPAGYEVDGMEVFLLDDEGRKLGFNCVGEIAVRSRYISLGYWQRPDLTRTNFLSDPKGGDNRTYLTGDLGCMRPDGCLMYLGRKDLQTKVRGNRVEVGEVEAALFGVDNVKEAVVVAQEEQAGHSTTSLGTNKRLVAYIVPTGQPGPSVSALRQVLSEKLPDYMIPSRFVFLETLPLTPNGKINRRALPDPGNLRPELDTPLVTPRTRIETELASIWAEILFLDQVGIHDNFFDLGGHSLAATRIVSQVIKYFQVDLPLASLFESPTVAEMANLITENQAKKLGEEDLNTILFELESLSDEQAQRLVATEPLACAFGTAADPNESRIAG